jgi:septal ring factor EnvC (AmiA/AmiB activator)
MPLAFLGVALVLASCTCKIREEQMSQIRQLRTEEKQTASDIQRAEAEKARVDKELASRQGDVRQCNQRLSFVQQKKAQWPNVFQDWDPNSPEPAAAEPTTPQPKKKK